MYAAQIAVREHAVVDVCSVVDEATIMLPVAEGVLVNPALLDAIESAAGGHVADAVRRLEALGVQAAGAPVLNGSPSVQIDAFARRKDADAIFIGTNGRNGMERMLLGSVTTALLCVTDIPVVTVHADDSVHSGPMLVAIDASAASAAALDCAIEQARAAGTALQLVHVFEDSQVDRLGTALGLRTGDARRHALTAAETVLETAAERVRDAGITFTSELVAGAALTALLTAVERHGAGSIAIGTHGRNALERLALGSVSDGVVRNARVPVYVVPQRRITARGPHPVANVPGLREVAAF